jgi:sodium-dependent dicarboxylate transporter 2/3/5
MSENPPPQPEKRRFSATMSTTDAPPLRVARAGLIGGLVALAAMLALPRPAGMSPAAWHTAAVGAVMAIWWMTEALPLAATALLPLVAFPLLGVGTIEAAAAPYANPVIFLFLGGFIIAAALEDCGLHRRFALAIVRVSGTGPRGLVGGFMAATAATSMWVSNTATAAMMLPMALATIAWHDERPDAHPSFAPALLLGVAYAASIGGVGTLIGTPPNALIAGFMAEAYGVRLGFLEWMAFGVPIVLLGVPAAWLLLIRTFRLSAAGAASAHAAGGVFAAHSGPLSRGEWTAGGIAGLTAIAWLSRPVVERWVPGLSDAGIAVAGALLLLMVPADRGGRAVVTWERVERVPWGTLIMFGGGLSLAAAIQTSELADWIGAGMRGLASWPLPLIVAAVAAAVIFLSELASNTSVAAVFLPVVGSVAVSLGAPPLVLALAAAVGASTAFMLPVGTPPNAIVYGSGRIGMPQMIRAGLLLDVIFVAIVTAAVLGLAPLVFPAAR